MVENDNGASWVATLKGGGRATACKFSDNVYKLKL